MLQHSEMLCKVKDNYYYKKETHLTLNALLHQTQKTRQQIHVPCLSSLLRPPRRPADNGGHKRRQRGIHCRRRSSVCRITAPAAAIAYIVPITPIITPIVPRVVSSLFAAFADGTCPPVDAGVARARPTLHTQRNGAVVVTVVDAVIRRRHADATIRRSDNQVVLSVA